MQYYYHYEIPEWLEKFCDAPSLERLKNVGMNCGCEYTKFDYFKDISYYSRHQHSLGCALIVWHFTNSMEQSLSALFHDISSPVFAHTIDFLHGDYETQESTEEGTEETIQNDEKIRNLLKEHSISIDDVKDYHRYPIADNDSPKLSSDRLEYTLGNAQNYGLATKEECQAWYEDLVVDIVDGKEELLFQTEEIALSFAQASLQCSKIYVSKEARYTMQRLAEVIKKAIQTNVLSRNDLNKTEQEVIASLQKNPDFAKEWEEICSLHQMITEEAPLEKRRVVPAKKRWIDPYVQGKGRLTSISKEYKEATEAFLQESFDEWICAK